MLMLLPSVEPIERHVSQWLDSLSASGASPRTIAAYGRDVRAVVALLPPNTDARQLGPAALDRALSGLTGAPASLQRARSAVRAWGRWLEQMELVAGNPARAIRTKRLPGTPPDHLSDSEVRRLLKVVRQTDTTAARRDRVWVEVLLHTGIRVSELAGLDLQDVDLESKHLRVRVKGGAVQTRFLRTDLRALLARHLRERHRSGSVGSGESALWLSNQGTRLTVRQIQRQLQGWLRAAGIEKRLGPHGLRHTFATALYERSRDLLVVQRALGHASVETTRRYTHLCDDALQEAIERL